MSDPNQDTVAAAQRRLLEAIAQLGPTGDAEAQSQARRGLTAMLFRVGRAAIGRGHEAVADGDEATALTEFDVSTVLSELGRLVAAVEAERREVSV